MRRLAAALALASAAALADQPKQPAKEQPAEQAITAADFAYPGSKTYTPRTSFTAKEKKGHEKSASVAEKAVEGTSLLAYSTPDSIEKVLAHYASLGAKKGLQKVMEEDVPHRNGKLVGYMSTSQMRIVSVQVYPKCTEEDSIDGARPPADQRLIYINVQSM
jgi:hypothetical protein